MSEDRGGRSWTHRLVTVVGLAVLLVPGFSACGSEDGPGTENASGSSGAAELRSAGTRDEREDGSRPTDPTPADAASPPFNFAGDVPGRSVEDAFADGADAGQGTLEFADGRDAALELTYCPQFSSRFKIDGRGETTDGQRFSLEIEHRQGTNSFSMRTTADPRKVAPDSQPVWNSGDVFRSTMRGREIELRDFWVFATVRVDGGDGLRILTGHAGFVEDFTKRVGPGSSQDEALEAIDWAAERQAAQGLAAKIARLSLTCS